eukprot:9214120-Pyramimonas_sp.AAC.1
MLLACVTFSECVDVSRAVSLANPVVPGKQCYNHRRVFRGLHRNSADCVEFGASARAAGAAAERCGPPAGAQLQPLGF